MRKNLDSFLPKLICKIILEKKKPNNERVEKKAPKRLKAEDKQKHSQH